MSRKTEQMKKLIEERARLAKQIDALQGELRGIDRAISLMTGEPVTVPNLGERRPRAKNVKETVISLVEKAGDAGLNVHELLLNAQRENIHLERGTVSSLLSRFKKDNVLDMKGGRYFFCQGPTLKSEEISLKH